MKVIKFGGSSLANGTQLRKVLKIVQDDPERRIVVVSAPGKRFSDDKKVTDQLIKMATLVQNQSSYKVVYEDIISQ